MPAVPYPKNPKTLLEMRMPFAATPQRVEQAARMLGHALDAADPELPEGSVTMVVFNLDMRVELRVQKPAGRRAVLAVSGMMSNPLRTVQRKPLTKHIADSMAKHGKALQSLAPEIFTPGRPDAIAKIDANFVHVMEGAARHEAPERDVRRGTSETYGRVLRIGRKEEGDRLACRVRIDDHVREIHIADSAGPDVLRLLFDAARDSAMVRLQTTVTWVKDAGGAWDMDGRSALVTGATAFEPASGIEFSDAALAAIEPRTDEEIADIIEDLERR